MKYLEEDLEAIAKKEKTLKEVALKYGVTQSALRRCLNRHNYHSRKVKIIIRTPYNSAMVGSVQECAETLKLSRSTIYNALNGKPIKTLDDLGIKLEVVKR